jgi:hypothetical protein
MTDKQLVKHLLDILLRLETKNEAFALSQSILNTIDRFGVYEKIGRDKKEIHFKAFNDYIETLGIQKDLNANLLEGEYGIFKEILSVL